MTHRLHTHMTLPSAFPIKDTHLDISSYNIMSQFNFSQSGNAALTNVGNAIANQILNKMILVAKATEATHSGLGRRKREGRAKVKSAVSIQEANKRDRKSVV